MEIYQSEEQQLEAIKKWWQNNGRSVIVGIAAGIVIVVGWNLWQNVKTSRTEQASLMYEQMLKAIQQEQPETAEKVGERIVELHKGSPYASLATLYQAKLKVENGDLEGAKTLLQALLKREKDDYLRHVVRLRLGRILLGNEEYEAGLKLLADVDPSGADAFEGSYEELKGDFYVGLDRLPEARTAYERALDTGKASPLVAIKLDDIRAPEAPEATE